jgi:hypothetical protein
VHPTNPFIFVFSVTFLDDLTGLGAVFAYQFPNTHTVFHGISLLE